MNAAVESFVKELKDCDAWDDVVFVTMSDFGRTLTSNGMGTDHGWGGNHVLLGGGVNGKRILGQYPSSLDEDSDVNIGRGRVLPTTSWEAVWHGITQWMDVDSNQLEAVLPNKINFPDACLFNKGQMFD